MTVPISVCIPNFDTLCTQVVHDEKLVQLLSKWISLKSCKTVANCDVVSLHLLTAPKNRI